jgi:TonB family protein
LSGSGVFRLFLGVNGRVTSIKSAQSTGHKELDIEAMKAIRWRVKPTAVKYIDVPATFTAEGKSAPLLYDRAIGEITSQTERQVG